MKITINNQTIEITEEQRKGLLESLSKPVRKIRPQEGEIYYYIMNLNQIGSTCYNADSDKIAWDLGDGLFTKEEAQKELNKRIAIQKVKDYIIENDLSFEPDWRNEQQNKYYIYFDNRINKFEFDSKNKCDCNPKISYFKSEEDCKKVIHNCRKELKIIFDVK